MALHNVLAEPCQCAVLALGVGDMVGTIEFDADGKVITVVAAVKAGLAGMPCPHQGRCVLGDAPVTGNEKMGADSHVPDAPDEGIVTAIVRQVAVKKGINMGLAKLVGR